VQVPVAGPLVGVFFTASPVRDYDGATASAATGRYPGLMHGLLDRGVAIAPGAYEILFPSLAHGDSDLDATVEAFAAAAGSLASTTRS
jgi:glutamate-1-semialdehyde 2,1-aminomutase